MSTKAFKELKNLANNELVTKAREIEASLFQVRMKKSTGQLEDTGSIWRLRKDLARVKTLQSLAVAQSSQGSPVVKGK